MADSGNDISQAGIEITIGAQSVPAKSCKSSYVPTPRQTLRHRLRMWSLAAVHFYIAFHLISWHVFGYQIWGKTAMMGVPSLVRGNINAAAIMVLLIIGSIFLFGRGFCGWVCHMRGAIELSDWLLRKIKIRTYKKIRDKNILLNTRYRWMFRFGALFILLLPVIVYINHNGYLFEVNTMSPPPLADLPGYENKLFAESAPINVTIDATPFDMLTALFAALFILFTMGVLLNLFYGQGAFCRILCPYAPLFVPFMNISKYQKKITRVNQCDGCRSCSNACPQGIDVSREIYNNQGKVTNRECIKCHTCIDACDSNVLRDTALAAVDQVVSLKSYEKYPWQKAGLRNDGYINESKHVQAIESMDHVSDFLSVIVGLASGGIASQFGGFWFYPGAIAGFVIFRKIYLYFSTRITSLHRLATGSGAK